MCRYSRFLAEGGSSPLARGTHAAVWFGISGERLIPARAGNTSEVFSVQKASAAHPRSRGEHFITTQIRIDFVGSSPLARGTLSHLPAIRIVNRLIPARAGNTRNGLGVVKSTSAHPRSRGEHHFLCDVHHVDNGSSPLARGTPHSTKPASVSVAAHPRSRGEHFKVHHHGICHRGSSPLARGTQPLRRAPILHHRLIPARAGNTLTSPLPPAMPSAHPRSRGEHREEFSRAVATYGSSPLARGTHQVPG